MAIITRPGPPRQPVGDTRRTGVWLRGTAVL